MTNAHAENSTQEKDFDLAVLYVEDEDVPRERLAAILSRKIRDVHLAADGMAGLEQYRKHLPDIVITDIRMPRMNGLDMSLVIRKIDPGARIIVTSAFSETELLMKAIDIEIDGYILKPVDSERLFSVIAKSAEIIGLRREVRTRDRKQKELISDLQKALSEIKTLRGILPICSMCKKIRDDKGYWNQVEHYISQHTHALFSHGICPDCIRQHYPDMADKILGEGDNT